MKPKVALFIHHPECSQDCCNGIIRSLSEFYDIKLFSENECKPETLQGIDIVAFPGGIGDATKSYDTFFRRRAQQTITDYVFHGGRYLGICMGAFWAGSYYFDILNGIDAVQYIKRPGADIRRPYGTIAPVTWLGVTQEMYFYDGTAFVGDASKFTTVATYSNGDPMAIIQNRIGLIGCHPESEEHWYKEPYEYISDKWHNGLHHLLLLDFVNHLMQY
jgi:glutamine amidotransferase-like uncharacterized protein